MTVAVRVQDDYVGLMGRYVAEGQAISPGAPLLDIMTPEGVVETILSEGWGIVAHVEGGRIFAKLHEDDEREEGDDEDDDDEGESGSARGGSGGSSSVFPKGSVICHIVAQSQRGMGKLAGLHPRNGGIALKRRLGRIAAPS